MSMATPTIETCTSDTCTAASCATDHAHAYPRLQRTAYTSSANLNWKATIGTFPSITTVCSQAAMRATLALLFVLSVCVLVWDSMVVQFTVQSIVYHNINTFNNVTYKIPKICYQTWANKNISSFSVTTRETIAENKRLNPDIEFVIWDDNDVDSFLKEKFAGDTYKAFQSINPKFGALRADFFRYCVMYELGGVYLDIKSGFKVPHVFGDIILPPDEAVLDVRKNMEAYRITWGYPTYEQWFLAFAPKHPYMKKMVEKITQSILRRVEIHADNPKERTLRLTGPDALAVAIHDAIVEGGVRHREVDYMTFAKHSKTYINPEYAQMNRTHYKFLDPKESIYLRRKA